jgi:diguanylate cyclase (GGDEF)-like protein
MGSRHALRDAHLVIGRGEDCDIRIEDNSVSRRHGRVYPSKDGYLVEDLQSTNGTFVNDEPVSVQPLNNGDYLRIGNCIFRYLADGNVESAYHEEIYRLTIIDGLTGIHNKRYFLEFLDRELSRSARYLRPLSLILFDIDHFKVVNDHHGHLAGDFVLRELAQMAKSVVRTEELLARYGGEEFAVVLPETSAEGAFNLAERLRSQVESHSFLFENKTLGITISVGMTTTQGETELDVLQLILRADKKLYEAKRAGRNRVAA